MTHLSVGVLCLDLLPEFFFYFLTLSWIYPLFISQSVSTVHFFFNAFVDFQKSEFQKSESLKKKSLRRIKIPYSWPSPALVFCPSFLLRFNLMMIWSLTARQTVMRPGILIRALPRLLRRTQSHFITRLCSEVASWSDKTINICAACWSVLEQDAGWMESDWRGCRLCSVLRQEA